MRPLTDLVGSTEFAIGLLVGTVVLLIALPASLGLRTLVPRKGRRPGLFGPALGVGGFLALDGLLGTDELLAVPSGVGWGLLLLWVAGAVAARTASPAIVGALAALPGALLVAGANDGLAAAWVPVVIVLGTVLVGTGAADLDRRTARLGLGPLLMVIAVVGIYFTVPDTELMRAVVGVALPLVLLAWPYTAASLGSGGAYVAVAFLLWVVPTEGIGRPGAVVGAVGAFGLLALEPAGRALVPFLERRLPLHRFPVTRPRTVFVVGQIVLTLYASRVAGMAQDAFVAAIALVPAIAAGLAFGAMVSLPERRRRQPGRRRRAAAPESASAPSSPEPSRPPSPSFPEPSPHRPPGPNPNGWSNGHSNGHGTGHG